MNKEIVDVLEASPVIAAVKQNSFSDALDSPCDIVFLTEVNIMTIAERVCQAHEKNKTLFVHIDLAEGIGKDASALNFLKNLNVDGIISTKSAVIRMAKDKGFLTVLRVFALDSQSIKSAVETAKSTKPDFVEVLPGVARKVVCRFGDTRIPVILGGLVTEKNEVLEALDSGATAISTGKKELWYI